MARGDHISDPRGPAWEAVRDTAATSAITAVKFLGGAAAVAAAIGGGAAVLGKFSLSFMAGLAAMTVATFPISFVILEIVRLGKSHRLLREVLESERTYESLLSDARQERDNLNLEVQRLRLGHDLTRAIQGLANLAGAPGAPSGDAERREEPGNE